jgi:hypothetical protein
LSGRSQRATCGDRLQLRLQLVKKFVEHGALGQRLCEMRDLPLKPYFFSFYSFVIAA